MTTNSHLCDICGSPKKLVPAGTSRDGKRKWDSFMGCPNFKSHPVKEPQQPQQPKQNNDVLLMEEVAALNKRLDDAGEYVAKLELRIRELERKLTLKSI